MVQSENQAGGNRRIDLIVVIGHALLWFMHSAANLSWLVPVLARKEFDAGEWQTVALTAAVPTLLLSSIFWNALMQRLALWQYLSLLWLVGGLPYAALLFVDSYTQVVLVHIGWSLGHAGWIPLSGKLMKWFYRDSIHGRVFSGLLSISLLAGMLNSRVGGWMGDDADSFRWIFPIAAGVQLLGFLSIQMVAKRIPAPPSAKIIPVRRMLLEPIQQVVSILGRDRVFFRYEMAFMTYGAGFMICEVLLPVLVTDGLKLSYDEYADSTALVRSLVMLLAMWPWGIFLDRIGAVRVSAIAFAILAAYPVLLMLATSYSGLALASVPFGLGLSAIALTWTLGPVAFAPTLELVPKYTAIHAMCVGIRGIVFQSLGMLLYELSDSFALPFAVAAVLFLWGARQMWCLHRDVKRAKIALAEQVSQADDAVSALEADVAPGVLPVSGPTRATV